MIEFYWDIFEFYCKDTAENTGVVHGVRAARYGSLEGYGTHNVPTEVFLEVSDISNFIEFDSLSKEDVVAWLENAISTSKLNEIDQEIRNVLIKESCGDSIEPPWWIK